MIRILLALAGLTLTGLATPVWAATTCAPSALVTIVTRNVTPGVVADSFAAKPLVLYRSGAHFMRNEEAADSAQGLHLLTIINAPDLWVLNLVDHRGKHMVDPGPSIDVHAPMFVGKGISAAFMALEYGCEADFARDHMQRVETAERIAGAAVSLYQARAGSELLELKLGPGGAPIEAGYYQAGKPMLVIHYDVYRAGLPPDPALFEKPEGFALVEPGAPQ